MSRDEAHALLNLARAGGLVPTHFITQALGVTGDLATRVPQTKLADVMHFWPTYDTPDVDEEEPLEPLEVERVWPYYSTPTGKAA